MAHFGILCLAATGHINTLFPLGQTLQHRGHRITVLSAVKVRDKAEAAGFEFHQVYSLPDEDVSQSKHQRSNLSNIRQTMQSFASIAQERLQKTPAIIQSQKIDALLVDLSVFEGGTIADYLNIPYVTVCCLLPFYRDIAIPPIFTTWQYRSQGWAKLRNYMAYKLSDRLAQPIWQVINRYRQQWQLTAYTHDNDFFSKLAIITRHVSDLEFPRKLPPHFHFTGPFHQAIERQPVAFPFEQLTGKPLVYASMGTLQNRDCSTFCKIAVACSELDVQLVISLGGGLALGTLPNLAGDPIVVSYAPQLELLERAALTITHAGLNTTLEALSYGVPIVAIPITDDQPGVAARVVWSGVGEFLSPSDLSAAKLKTKISQVLTEESYRLNAVQVQIAILRTVGVNKASLIVEQAILNREPVVNL